MIRSPRIVPAATIRLLPLLAALLLNVPTSGQCDVPASIGGLGGVSKGLDVVGDFAFSVEHARLTSFDITNPAAPRPVGTLLLSANFLWDVKVADGIAVCADAFWGVRIVDVHDPAAPFYLATYDTPYGPESVAIADGIVYAADGNYSVKVIDIHDPRAPFLRSSIPISHSGGFYAQEVVIDGTTLYVGSEAYGKVALDIVDVSNPSAPVNRGSLVLNPGYPVGASDLAVAGTIAYLTDTSAGLHVIDVSNSAAPVEVATLPGPAGVVKPYGSRLLVGRGASVDVVDVSIPSAPTVIGNVALPREPDDVAITGDVAILGLYDHGLATLDLSDPDAPVLVATSATPDDALDVVVTGGLAYVADGQFGLKIFDLGNPIVPLPIGHAGTPGRAYGIAVSGGVAYVADGDAGLAVFDVTEPSDPTLLGVVDTPGLAEDVAVSGNRAYVADGTQGLRVVDVSDPAAPVLLGHVGFPGVNAEATGVTVAGDLVYASDRYYGLRIVDVTNPADPFIRSTTDTYSYSYDVVVDGSVAYVADYSRRFYSVDVSNPDAPAILWSGPINGASSGLALAGDRLYAVHSQGGYLQTFDVTNPAAPVELPSVNAPTLGRRAAAWNGFLIGAYGSNGVRTFRTDGLPYVHGPADVQALPGADVSFAVAAAGQTGSGAQTLGFAWRKNGIGLEDGPTGSGSVIAGAATPRLEITNVQESDAGSYDVEVSNDCGITVSASAALAVGIDCPADIDGSGAVDFGDLIAVLSAWGTCEGCPEDLDGSGAVDFQDLLIVLGAWGPCE